MNSDSAYKSELHDGMCIDWDVPIMMDDGVILRADVYRPNDGKQHPCIASAGPYAKYLQFQTAFPDHWKRMCQKHPDVLKGSSNKYQNFEAVDPEKFVPDGYAIVRIDSRGTGRSPGYLDPWSLREAQDLYQCIEWMAKQPWSNGKVGLNGISYLGMNQWQVATLQPPHLKALCIWEGAADYYRDMTHHGGILCTFGKPWYEVFILSVQNGRGVRGMRSLMTDDWVSGPNSLTDEELGSNRCDWHLDCRQNHIATDEFWTSRRPDFSKIKIPLLSAANWGGQGLHLRGNIEGFVHVASEQKWLEFHGEEHWTHFYTDYGVDIQKRFFGRYLMDKDNGWDKQPKILMQVRHPGERFVKRHENEWPLARTRWTKYYLKPEDATLQDKPLENASSVTYRGFSPGVTFMTPPLDKETEITGPMAAKLFVSSSTDDADLFLVVRVFGPDLKEVTFQGTHDMHAPISLGWLRASHRKLDPKLSRPYRPHHVHDEIQKLIPGQIYELDIEIWPSCIVIPKGYRLALSVRGKDYEYPGGGGLTIKGFSEEFTGVGPFRHNDPVDRPASTYNGDVVVHCGPEHQSYLLIPVIPST